MVKKAKIGFTTVFKKAKTMATIKAVRNLSVSFTPVILTPGKSQDVTITASVDMISFNMKFMVLAGNNYLRKVQVIICNLVVS